MCAFPLLPLWGVEFQNQDKHFFGFSFFFFFSVRIFIIINIYITSPLLSDVLLHFVMFSLFTHTACVARVLYGWFVRFCTFTMEFFLFK